MEKDIERLEQATIYQITQNVTIKKKIDKWISSKLESAHQKTLLRK